MKVYPDKLAAHLKEAPRPVYIVSGDEPLLGQEVCDQIRGALREQGFTERDLFHAESGFDWDSVLFSANSMSLFADRRLIELRLPTGKPGDKGSKALLAYIAEPNDETVMLLVLPRLDQQTQRSKWFKALESAGVFVQVWPIDRNQLPRWIQDRMRRAGLTADRDAVDLLIDRVEGNLLAASQEIERLRLLTEDGRVDADLVLRSVSDSTRFDVFGLIDAAIAQQSGRCVKMLRGLRSEGADPLFLNSMLAREVRSVIGMQDDIAAGKSIDAVLKSARVWPKRKAAMGLCLKQTTVPVLQDCLRDLGLIDRQVKGAAIGDPWDTLEHLILCLAGQRNLPGNALTTSSG